jgi:hypothetical protein
VAFVKLVVMNEFGKRALCPAPWCWIEFVREGALGNWDGDAFGVETPFAAIFPVEMGARKRCVCQSADRDVVEDVVAREALGSSLKDARDQLVAPCVVIEEIRRGRWVNPRFPTTSAVAAPSGTRT